MTSAEGTEGGKTTDGINKIEKHLNKQAHDMEE